MLMMHLSMCRRCRKYKEQLKTLYLTYQKLKINIENDPEIHLSDEVKEKIKKDLNQHSKH